MVKYYRALSHGRHIFVSTFHPLARIAEGPMAPNIFTLAAITLRGRAALKILNNDQQK
jgi:hypothetical protein